MLTPIEAAADAAASGGQPEHDALIHTFLDATVAVPSATDPSSAPLEPVIIDIDEMSHMVVGDSLEALQDIAELASFAVTMSGRDVVRGLGTGHAVLVRMAGGGGFALDAELVEELREADYTRMERRVGTVPGPSSTPQ